MASVFERIMDDQYRRPAGWLGEWIGSRIARDHHPENLWTVQVLQVRPADQVLEVGFGPGVAIQELEKIIKTGSISGIDFSRTMLAAARRRNAAAVLAGKVKLYHGEAGDLPFPEKTFDRAFSIHSIYFWSDPLADLREIWRVLKPGGLLALTILPKEQWNPGQPDRPVGTPQCRPYSGTELSELLKEAGFGPTRIVSDPDPRLRSNYSVLGER